LLENKAFISPDTYGYLMPKSRSYDIDDEEDWTEIESILSRSLNQK